MAKRDPKIPLLAQEGSSGKTTVTYNSTNVTTVTLGEIFTWKEVILTACQSRHQCRASRLWCVWKHQTSVDICNSFQGSQLGWRPVQHEELLYHLDWDVQRRVFKVYLTAFGCMNITVTWMWSSCSTKEKSWQIGLSWLQESSFAPTLKLSS